MRLPVRRLASTTLSAFLLLGVTGTTALAAGGDQPGESTAAVAQAPVADAETLLAQTQNLGALSTVLKPTTDLLNAVLKADGGRLAPQDSARYAAAVREAITKIGTTQATTLPAPASASTATSTSVSPAASTATTEKAAPAPGVDADALSSLQKSVDTLLESSVAGDTARIQNAANDVVTGLVNIVTTTLAGSGMPAADAAGLPNVPQTQQQPATDQSTAQQPASQQSSGMPASETQASEQQAPQTSDMPQSTDTAQTSGMPESGQQPTAQDAAVPQEAAAELPAS